MNGAIAAAGDHGVVTSLYCAPSLLGRESRSLALNCWGLYSRALQNAEHALDQRCAPRPIASSSAIVDDKSSAHAMKNEKYNPCHEPGREGQIIARDRRTNRGIARPHPPSRAPLLC